MLKKLSLILLVLLMTAAAAAQSAVLDGDVLLTQNAGDEVFIRIDRDDPEAWRGALSNLRFLENEHMSGSAQFSQAQFFVLAAQLKQRAERVYIVDCRLESHGLINGVAISLCAPDNAANLGKDADEVEQSEAELEKLVGHGVTAWTSESDRPVLPVVLNADSWQTERELVEGEGLNYVRLLCPDHCWPPAEVIDAFIQFAGGLEDGAWLHFHCQAGSGRTGAFMTIYEMMQRPDAAVEEILRHQAETGSGNLVDRSAPDKSPAQKERCVLARAMYLYIRENRETGYARPWSDWLDAHSVSVSLKTGETLGQNCFSSDPLVLSDDGRALRPGAATVLAGDSVFCVTVE